MPHLCLPFRTRILVCEKCPFPSVFLWATKSAFSIQYLFDGSLCFLSTGKLSYSQCSYFIEWTIHPHNREFIKSQLCTFTLIFSNSCLKHAYLGNRCFQSSSGCTWRSGHWFSPFPPASSAIVRRRLWFCVLFLQLKTTSNNFVVKGESLINQGMFKCLWRWSIIW